MWGGPLAESPLASRRTISRSLHVSGLYTGAGLCESREFKDEKKKGKEMARNERRKGCPVHFSDACMNRTQKQYVLITYRLKTENVR